MRPSLLLVHGYNSTAESYFFPSLRSRYQKNCDVSAPTFPHPLSPNVDAWTDVFLGLKTKHFSVVVAHSLGGTFVLGLLSRGHLTADHLLLISVSPGPKEKPEMNNFLKYPLEFTRINAAAKNIVVAQSLDDPWTYPEYANVLVKDTKGTGMLYADRGHFESEALPDDILSVIDRWTSFS